MAIKISLRERRSFTIAEVLVTGFIALLIFMAAWAIYMMGWTWWYQVSPRIEAQRAARLAITYITKGASDDTAGFDIIGSSRYGRRNGIGAAMWDPVIPNTYTINYGLYQDRDALHPATPKNVRSFYLGTDPGTGRKGLYYKDSGNVTHKIDATSGLTDLRFTKAIDPASGRILVTVTATAEKDVAVGGAAPYHIKVEYSDYAYLKNAQ